MLLLCSPRGLDRSGNYRMARISRDGGKVIYLNVRELTIKALSLCREKVKQSQVRFKPNR